MCANSIFHQKLCKDSTKNDKMPRKTVGCVEKNFFYGVGTYRCVLCRTVEMRVTCVTPADMQKYSQCGML